MKRKLLYLIPALIFIIIGSAQAQVSVIVNKSLAGASINKATLKSLYSMDKKKVGSAEVVLFDLKGAPGTKSTFLGFIGETEKALNEIWMKAKLTGAGNPPRVVDESEIVKKVAATPNAIGFVSSSKVTDDVKVVLEIKK